MKRTAAGSREYSADFILHADGAGQWHALKLVASECRATHHEGS